LFLIIHRNDVVNRNQQLCFPRMVVWSGCVVFLSMVHEMFAHDVLKHITTDTREWNRSVVAVNVSFSFLDFLVKEVATFAATQGFSHAQIRMLGKWKSNALKKLHSHPVPISNLICNLDQTSPFIILFTSIYSFRSISFAQVSLALALIWFERLYATNTPYKQTKQNNPDHKNYAYAY